jgi:hypothetical protein
MQPRPSQGFRRAKQSDTRSYGVACGPDRATARRPLPCRFIRAAAQDSVVGFRCGNERAEPEDASVRARTICNGSRIQHRRGSRRRNLSDVDCRAVFQRRDDPVRSRPFRPVTALAIAKGLVDSLRHYQAAFGPIPQAVLPPDVPNMNDVMRSLEDILKPCRARPGRGRALVVKSANARRRRTQGAWRGSNRMANEFVPAPNL